MFEWSHVTRAQVDGSDELEAVEAVVNVKPCAGTVVTFHTTEQPMIDSQPEENQP